MPRMPGMSTERCLAAIEDYSHALADAARGNLDARVEHCPDWDVADLVWHVANVHWFWTTIAEELPQEPPDRPRPERPSDPDALLAMFEAGARRMVEVFGAADQSARCWTWAPQKDVAFITRHQVQEAAVHAWDAAHAAGRWLDIDARAAADAIEEFLTVSVSSADDPADPPRPALAGAIWVCACAGREGPSPRWLVSDGPAPGTVAWRRVPDDTEPTDLVEGGVPLVGGHVDPAAFLLWLYGRVEQPFEGGPSGDTDVLARFRALTYTD
jgi:uncharacterized protein (TIGR03083 family)